MTLLYSILLFLSAFLFSAAGTGGAWVVLRRLAVMDTPEERSNHETPTPRGGGIAVVATLLMFLLVARAPGEILLAILLLAAVSFYDDVRRLSPLWRLGAQALAAILALGALDGALVFQGLLPLWLDYAVTVLLWLWFINLYNFMDGIDEITSVETLSLCAGLALLAISVGAIAPGVAVDAATIAGAVLGFWLWNRHPARIFLGDVGSIPLGLLMGWLLLGVAAAGYWQAALILPAYYLGDATFTLVRRLLKKEKIWQAHSQHAYQQAVRAGRTHHDVVSYVLALNMLLVVLAVVSTLSPLAGWLCLAVAYGLAAALMRFFHISRLPVIAAASVPAHA